MSLASMMTMSAVIKRPQIGRDADEGVTQAYTTVASNLPCAVMESGASPMALYAQRNAGVPATIYFLQDPGTQINDIAVVTDCLAGTSKTYIVKGWCFPTSRGKVWQVSAEWIQQPY